MSFPVSPSNLDEYTNGLGTVYRYIAADGKWIIKSQEITGATGLMGPTGIGGVNGVTGIAGVNGATGSQGVTGLSGTAGAAGATGSQGVTGISGTAGAAGATGSQGVTGVAGVGITYNLYNAGNFGSTGATINLTNGYSQYATVVDTGSTGLIFVSGGATGSKYSVEFRYNVNQAPRGSTGIKWSPTVPVLSGYTGVKDMMYIYASGQDYIGVASLGHSY